MFSPAGDEAALGTEQWNILLARQWRPPGADRYQEHQTGPVPFLHRDRAELRGVQSPAGPDPA